jgi:hypothetical protein
MRPSTAWTSPARAMTGLSSSSAIWTRSSTIRETRSSMSRNAVVGCLIAVPPEQPGAGAYRSDQVVGVGFSEGGEPGGAVSLHIAARGRRPRPAPAGQPHAPAAWLYRAPSVGRHRPRVPQPARPGHTLGHSPDRNLIPGRWLLLEPRPAERGTRPATTCGRRFKRCSCARRCARPNDVSSPFDERHCWCRHIRSSTGSTTRQ